MAEGQEGRGMSETPESQERPAMAEGQESRGMAESANFQYTVIRVVPRVEREEFVNVGVVLFCRTCSYLAARVELNERLLTALAPEADVEAIKTALEAYVRIAAGDVTAGEVARLSQSERYHWLSAPSSTVVQTSPGHSGVSRDPAATLEHLFATLVL